MSHSRIKRCRLWTTTLWWWLPSIILAEISNHNCHREWLSLDLVTLTRAARSCLFPRKWDTWDRTSLKAADRRPESSAVAEPWFRTMPARTPCSNLSTLRTLCFCNSWTANQIYMQPNPSTSSPLLIVYSLSSIHTQARFLGWVAAARKASSSPPLTIRTEPLWSTGLTHNRIRRIPCSQANIASTKIKVNKSKLRTGHLTRTWLRFNSIRKTASISRGWSAIASSQGCQGPWYSTLQKVTFRSTTITVLARQRSHSKRDFKWRQWMVRTHPTSPNLHRFTLSIWRACTFLTRLTIKWWQIQS